MLTRMSLTCSQHTHESDPPQVSFLFRTLATKLIYLCCDGHAYRDGVHGECEVQGNNPGTLEIKSMLLQGAALRQKLTIKTSAMALSNFHCCISAITINGRINSLNM